MDVAVGRAVYAQFLNNRGGIEIDATVTRIDSDTFHSTSGAATRMRDLAYLRRNLPADVAIADLTEAYCVIGLMGKASAAMLQAIAPQLQEIPFRHSAEIDIRGAACTATRVSFVGEFGYELTIPNDTACAVFNMLVALGAQPMGHYALDGCRIEKGFKHWGHDLGPEITPLEAELGFTIDWNKDFLGKDALLRQRDIGPRQRLVLMQVEDDALMLHDEPIFEEGAHVGLTTSAAIGPRTGLNLAFGLIAVSPGETAVDTNSRRFVAIVAGRNYAARPLRRPPFDPDHNRMRA